MASGVSLPSGTRLPQITAGLLVGIGVGTVGLQGPLTVPFVGSIPAALAGIVTACAGVGLLLGWNRIGSADCGCGPTCSCE